jgi:hypothetical protein
LAKKSGPDRYNAIIDKVFSAHFVPGCKEFEFTREEFEKIAERLAIKLPKNLGDVLYSFRYRKKLPESIRATAGEGVEWIIEGAGKARYRFRQAKINRIVPRDDLVTLKIPDATPEIITAYALSDEQALLAKVRSWRKRASPCLNWRSRMATSRLWKSATTGSCQPPRYRRKI